MGPAQQLEVQARVGSNGAARRPSHGKSRPGSTRIRVSDSDRFECETQCDSLGRPCHALAPLPVSELVLLRLIAAYCGLLRQVAYGKLPKGILLFWLSKGMRSPLFHIKPGDAAAGACLPHDAALLCSS